MHTLCIPLPCPANVLICPLQIIDFPVSRCPLFSHLLSSHFCDLVMRILALFGREGVVRRNRPTILFYFTDILLEGFVSLVSKKLQSWCHNILLPTTDPPQSYRDVGKFILRPIPHQCIPSHLPDSKWIFFEMSIVIKSVRFYPRPSIIFIQVSFY